MPIRSPWNNEVIKFDNRGLDLIHPVDQVDAQHYSRFTNVKSVQEGTLQPRSGMSLVNSQAFEDTTPVITHSLTQFDTNGTTTTSHTSSGPNIAFQNNRLYIACISSETASGVATPSSVAGGSLTWVLIGTVTYHTLASPNSAIHVYRALVTSGATTSVFSWLTDVSTPTWLTIHEFVNVDLTGSNGSGAVVQFATNRQNSGDGVQIIATLNPFGGVKHAAWSNTTCDEGARSFTPGSGWTEIADIGAGGTMRAQTQWRDTNDTTADTTLDSDRDQAIFAIEIKNG